MAQFEAVFSHPDTCSFGEAAFLMSINNSKDTRDISPVVPAIQHSQTPATSKPVTLAGVTAPMRHSMGVCPPARGVTALKYDIF